ncbi:MAG TPA: DNA polymerase [Enhygromyxa sp.]|nr:DNA polymerase [Enhygromyxa sp.]
MAVSDPGRARAAIEQIVGRRPEALAIAFDLRDSVGNRLRAGDDARRARLEALAIAVPPAEAADRDQSTVLLLERGLLGDPATELPRLLAPLSAAERPPYLVFADAHRALTLFARLGIDPPPRFGCATVAATLLAEGADRRRDHRPLEQSVRELLGRELPEGLLSVMSTNHRLACEAEALLALLRAVTPTLRERRLARVFSFECELLPAVVAMESAGIGIDAAGFERVASSWVRERGEIEALPEPERDGDRVARLDKLISTYRWWARDYVDHDHRIRARLHPLAADSGRFACTEPNLQQVPAEHTAPGLRACFVPAPGHALVIADYAQIELRVAAHLAPCEALRAVFRAGRDPHRATAATLAGKPEHAVDSHERQLAKAVNFGFLFGMGARRFRSYARDSYGLELDERQAEDAREAFFRTFPGIAAWHRRVGALSRRATREPITVTTAMGRRRTFPVGKFSFNAALNIPVQGTAAEGFKLAMLRLRAPLAELGGRGVLVVHDEYLAELPIEQAERGRQVVEQLMIAAMRELVDSVPIVVEAEIAEHWS